LPYNIMLAIDLSYIIFMILKYDACVSNLFKVFTWGVAEVYQRFFLLLFRWFCDFCPWFYLYPVLCLLIWIFWTILYPWNEISLIILCDLFNVFSNSVYKYFIGNFCLYVYQGNWPIGFFCCCVLICFWY
jgi:hypothetical protein